MAKSSILLFDKFLSFLASAVVAEKESSSFDVGYAKSNQRLYKWFFHRSNTFQLRATSPQMMTKVTKRDEFVVKTVEVVTA
ncbi:hypothetical protein DAPPUDRAFT_269505 [Daphnia pulex]|uniref:Secreted protein n=1 Tax=Daphnia pulex TaxID=6669 RepID=E9HZE5_DAPPU|nr:hypothetical protein DAPPUDRAFT_269505 [Daphnia pulex]|eukprot:EFX62884.1 hypothetical protein DAPPUDRAFT_269505 [Daphnia pulex]